MILFDIKTSERNIHNEVFLESRKKLTMVMTRTPKLNKNNTHTQIHIYIYIYTYIYISIFNRTGEIYRSTHSNLKSKLIRWTLALGVKGFCAFRLLVLGF